MTLAQTQLSQAKVSLFFDSHYVATAENQYNEATNSKLSLQTLGHKVSTFSLPKGKQAKAFADAVKHADVLYVPALYYHKLIPGDASAYIIRDFVRHGGSLVVNNDAYSDNATKFVNAVFDTDIVELSGADTTSNSRTGSTAGTTFAGDPADLPGNDDTDTWLTTSLPLGSDTLYSNGAGGSTVFGFQFGKGQVIMLGWDWEDAVPNGSQDGGWLQVLQSSISRTDGHPTGNIITGGGGNDAISTTQTVTGQPFATAFDDVIVAGDGNDKVDGGAGNDQIVGGKGKDKLIGNSGDDDLSGGAKTDKLIGGKGADDFVFDFKLGKAGVDKLVDFHSGEDHIILSHSVFTKLALGELSQTEFDKYIDVSSKGKISYDDGKETIAFAKIDSHAKLMHDDFLVVS